MAKLETYNVAIVGATGVVGKEMLAVLEELDFPVGELRLLASERSEGIHLEWKGESVKVQLLTKDSFEGIDIALFSAGASISKEFATYAVESGAIVIDNTSQFRMDPNIPLVVPEVNSEDLRKHQGIIANPNCSTAQMVLPIKAIHDVAIVKRVVVSTYQSVSGAGKEAMEELRDHATTLLNGKPTGKPTKFTREIAFNLIPHIDVFLENGYTKEEMKMILETRKIMGIPNLAITATTVRVPVFICHSESVNIETEKKLTAAEAKKIMSEFPGIEIMDDPKNNIYPTPQDAAGKNPTYVGRIREDESVPCGINLWVVADNLRKGAALNAVQIAQKMMEMDLI